MEQVVHAAPPLCRSAAGRPEARGAAGCAAGNVEAGNAAAVPDNVAVGAGSLVEAHSSGRGSDEGAAGRMARRPDDEGEEAVRGADT